MAITAPPSSASDDRGLPRPSGSGRPAARLCSPLIARLTRALMPKATTRSSSIRKVTPQRCASIWRSSLLQCIGTASSTHWWDNSSIRLLARATPSLGPNKRTSRRERSMWTLHPVSSCKVATLTCDEFCSVLVRMSSAHTGPGTDFRGPLRPSSLLRTAATDASEPLTWSTPRTRSSLMEA